MITKSKDGLKVALGVASGLIGSATIHSIKDLSRALVERGVSQEEAASTVKDFAALASDPAMWPPRRSI